MTRPNTWSRTGNNSGARLTAIATMTAPLIMLPNSRSARATVRDTSPIRLSGSMSTDGCAYCRRYARSP